MEKGEAFRRDMLPRKCDVIRHIWFLGNGKATRDAISGTANDLLKIWESADCPPKSRKYVVKQIDSLVKEYREPNQLRERRGPQKTTTRRTEELTAEQPSRCSTRNKKDGHEKREESSDCSSGIPSKSFVSDSEVKKAGNSEVLARTRKQKTENITQFPDIARMNWFDNEGLELFDILGAERLKGKDKVSKSVKNIPDRYDKEFYENQKSVRSKKIQKCTNDDYTQEKNEEEVILKRKKRRLDLALGNEVTSTTRQSSTDHHDDSSEEALYDDSMNYAPTENLNISAESCPRSVKTRNEDLNLTVEKVDVATISRATQTDISGDNYMLFPQLDTKIQSKKNGKEARLICPTILETIVECETVDRCSLDSAIRCLHAVANRVFMQHWKLPLSMDDGYLNDTKLLKKLELLQEAKDTELKHEVNEFINVLKEKVVEVELAPTPESYHCDPEVEHEVSEVINLLKEKVVELELESTLEGNHNDPELGYEVTATIKSLIEKVVQIESVPTPELHDKEINLEQGEAANNLETRIQYWKAKIAEHKQNSEKRLPAPRTVRKARRLISYEAERLVAEEILANKCAIIPDGTGRKIVGKVGGVVVQTKGKQLRTLPFQKMGNEKRDNWGNLIEYLLQRMSILTGKDKVQFWLSILLFISDQCKVNKGLADNIAKKLGVSYSPGQIYCNIHPILMFDEKMKKYWENCERKIGADKLFPSLSYANLDQDKFMVSIQCLDAMMGLVSPGKSNKAWSQYFNFNRYLDPRDNHSYSLKDRRFGQLPALCLVGLHHFDDIIQYLETVPQVRNQLACLCRGMMDLDDYLKFIWAAAGLLGVHFYEPYLFFVIDQNATQSQCLEVFPKLYAEMLAPTERFCQLETPAMKSLTCSWQSPMSGLFAYHEDVVSSLKKYIVNDADTDLIEKHIHSILLEFASGFSDQKGEAYGFGPNSKGKPTVLDQASNVEELDHFLTHSKPIENKFGHMDNLMNVFTPAGFQKACDAMVIAGAKDLVFDGSHSWKKLEKEKIKEIKVEEVKWSKFQDELRAMGVSNSDVEALERQGKLTALIETLQVHKGPLNTEEAIDDFMIGQRRLGKTEKEIAKMLNDEIRFRRDANLRYSLSKGCYLYKQRKITNEERVKNLKILVKRPEARSTATLDDLRDIYFFADAISDPCDDADEQHLEDDPVTSVDQAEKSDCSIESSQNGATDDHVTEKSSNNEEMVELAQHGAWPPDILEHIAILISEGWKIGEVKEIQDENHLIMRSFKKILIDDYEEYSLWQDTDKEIVVNKDNILPIRPLTELVPSLSTCTRRRRRIVFQVGNPEFIESLCTM